MEELYLMALLTGLVGSLHCIGMCGPIAVALPLGNRNYGYKILGSLTYNLGRILTYGILGAIFGMLGQGIEMAGLQQGATIGIGVIMILSVIFPALFKGKIKIEQLFFGYAGKLIGKFRQLFAISSLPSLFLIGLLNGLLPCGLVYVAVAGAINTNDTFFGIIYMVIFGLGTIPIMATIPLLGNIIGRNIRKRFGKVLPIFIVILGILFVMRGLSLGIPFISPSSKMLVPHEKMMTPATEKKNTMKMGCCGG